MGGTQVESVERDLTELYELSESTLTIQARQMIIKHESLVQKKQECTGFWIGYFIQGSHPQDNEEVWQWFRRGRTRMLDGSNGELQPDMQTTSG